MSDSVSVIYNISHENEAIIACNNLIRRSNDDLRKTLNQTMNSGWTQDNIRLVSDELWNLKQYIVDVHDGFKNHYLHEMDTLAPVVGDLLVQALRIDHQELFHQLGKVRKLLLNIEAENIKKKCYTINREIDTLCQLIETHNGKAEGMLQLFIKLFETKSQRHLSPQHIR